MIAVSSVSLPGAWYRVRLFADFSYSLYVVHFPLLVFTSATMRANRWKLAISFEGMVVFAVITVAIYLIVFIFASVTEFNTRQLKDWVHARLRIEIIATDTLRPVKE